MVAVAHDRNHRRTNPGFGGGLFSGGSPLDLFCRLLFERDHVGIGTEEAGHFTRQFRIQRLVDGSEDALRQQTRDQILRTNVQLLRQIFYTDAFGDGDAARDRLGLIRHHHAGWRRVALHRAFLHPARNITLTGTPRRPAGTATRTGCSWGWESWTYAQRARSRGRLPGGMHGATLAGTQRRPRWPPRASSWDGWTALKNRLSRHGTPGSGAHCAADGDSRLHRWGSRSHGRFVNRARPSLRNDHTRRRWRRSDGLCRNRWRGGSARRNYRSRLR